MPRAEGARLPDDEGRAPAGGQPAPRSVGGVARWACLARGWPVGLAAAWPWALFFVTIRLLPGMSGGPGDGRFVMMGAIFGGFLAAGVAFGRAAGLGWWRSAAVGIVHLAATFVGITVAGRVEELAVHEGRLGFGLGIWQLPLVFAGAFGQYVGLTLGATTLAAGLLGRVGRPWRTGLAAGALAVAGYVVVSLLLNLVPEWRIGGGHGAMVKVAAAANLIVLTLGASAALAVLRRHNRRA